MAGQSRMELFEEMLREDANDAELRYALAMEHASTGDHEGAVRRFEEMFTLVPDYAPAYHQAGLALVRLGRVEAARAALVRGIAIARKIGNVHAADEMSGLIETLG